METSTKQNITKGLWFARTLDANKQIHKKRMQEQMQTPEFLRVIETLKSKNAANL
jgi:hypothetical protein